MMTASDRRLLPANVAARRLRIPFAWLRGEILAKRLPGLVCDRTILVDVEVLEQALLERAGRQQQGEEAQA